MSPIDAARAHDLDLLTSWHGRVMVLVWGVIAPVTVLTARYFKILPWQNWPSQLDNPTWWRAHWIGQTGVIVFSFAGLAFILAADSPADDAPMHSILGYAVIAMVSVQGLTGLFRGTKGGPTSRAPDGSMSGDHFDMTPHRLAFEAIHKILGYAILMAAVACILLGLWTANAPRWMWLLLGIWWSGTFALAIALQSAYGSFDTYQAIWGPDPTLPGNRRIKQGWGTVRPGDNGGAWRKGDL